MRDLNFSVIFICLGLTGVEGARDVLLEAHRQNMTSPEYVYIIPWGLKSNFAIVNPWQGINKNQSDDKIAREAFKSAIIVSEFKI